MQRTGEGGRFRISGLRRGRDYTLRAWNERTLQIVVSEPIPAGTDGYVWRVPADVFRERIWGTVRGYDSTPLENIRVRLTMRVHQTRRGTSFHTGQEMHTGADGQFEFERVPREHLILRFTGHEIDSLYLDFGPDNSGEDLDVRIARRCHFRFEGSGGAYAPDTVRALDQDGNVMRLQTIEAGYSSEMERAALTNGHSGVMAVSEEACWLVLERNEREFDRLPLTLVPGEVIVVRQ